MCLLIAINSEVPISITHFSYTMVILRKRQISEKMETGSCLQICAARSCGCKDEIQRCPRRIDENVEGPPETGYSRGICYYPYPVPHFLHHVF